MGLHKIYRKQVRECCQRAHVVIWLNALRQGDVTRAARGNTVVAEIKHSVMLYTRLEGRTYVHEYF